MIIDCSTADNIIKTILIVEDQIIVALPVVNMLKKSGYNVIHAMTGEVALNIVKSGTSISIILMDVDMGPGIDGIAASEKITMMRNIPVIFFTNHTLEYVRERVAGSFPVNYLSKNSSSAALLNAIDKILFKLNMLNNDFSVSTGSARIKKQ